MNKRILAAVIAGSLLATSAYAGERGNKHDGDKGDKMVKEGAIGFGTGAGIGAIAGGPVGAIIGAAFGTWFGERFHEEKTGRVEAEQQLAATQQRNGTLESRLAGNERELARIRADLGNERVARRRQIEQMLAIDVYFRTEESALDVGTSERIADLAGLVTPVDGAMIRLEAHTDGRGTQKYNDELSVQRAAAVRDALIAGGLSGERIVVEATGESQATAVETDVEGQARERRVTMTIVDGTGLRVAQQVGQ